MNLEIEIELFLSIQDKSMVSTIEYSEEHNIFTFKVVNTNLSEGVRLSALNYGWKMWLASASREGYKLVPVDTLKAALDWMNYVESEWEGTADLTEDYKHRDIIEKAMIVAVE